MAVDVEETHAAVAPYNQLAFPSGWWTGPLMTQQMNQKILELKQGIVDEMVRFMKYGRAEDENDPNMIRKYDPIDAGYTQEHIDRCSVILDDFLASLEKTPGTQRNKYIMTVVKETILGLNQLDKECGLIDTAEREALAKLINSATRHAGLESSEDDITLEWREW